LANIEDTKPSTTKATIDREQEKPKPGLVVSSVMTHSLKMEKTLFLKLLGPTRDKNRNYILLAVTAGIIITNVNVFTIVANTDTVTVHLVHPVNAELHTSQERSSNEANLDCEIPVGC